MLLAIKGNINNVYRLQKPDCNTIEKYLNGISHSRFKKQKAAYGWVGIEVASEPLRFQDCIKKLKELGVIPKNEVITSCSLIQNIENDEERNKYYVKRKQEKLKKKEEKKLEKITKRNSEKDFSKIYAKEEPEKIKKMPGEFELTRIDTSMQENARGYFLWYIAEGGNNVAFGDFKGKVLKIEKDKGILFKEIFVEFDEGCGDVVNGKEDHVWIFDCQEFLNMGIQVGDCVKFNALAYAYKRQDGSIDFGLKAPQWIQYIPDYELPKDEDLNLQAIERMVCETCLYSEHCYGEPCIAVPGYKEVMTVQLLEASGASKEFVDKYILNHPIPNLIKNIDESGDIEECQN